MGIFDKKPIVPKPVLLKVSPSAPLNISPSSPPLIKSNPFRSTNIILPKKFSPGTIAPLAAAQAGQPQDATWFQGSTQFSLGNMRKKLMRDPKLRKELHQKLGIPLSNRKKLDEEIGDMLKMLEKGNKYNRGFFEKSEIARTLKELGWDARREAKKPYQDANWKKEAKERDITKKEQEFLKKQFGIK